MVYVSGLKAEGQDGRYHKFLLELQTLTVNYLNFISYGSYIKQYLKSVAWLGRLVPFLTAQVPAQSQAIPCGIRGGKLSFIFIIRRDLLVFFSDFKHLLCYHFLFCRRSCKVEASWRPV